MIIVNDYEAVVGSNENDDACEDDFIPEDMPEMEQEIFISLPNSAATTSRARPNHPFSRINTGGDKQLDE